jgi:hypothetical protein
MHNHQLVDAGHLVVGSADGLKERGLPTLVLHPQERLLRCGTRRLVVGGVGDEEIMSAQ